jgi:hypothetical protein
LLSNKACQNLSLGAFDATVFLIGKAATFSLYSKTVNVTAVYEDADYLKMNTLSNSDTAFIVGAATSCSPLKSTFLILWPHYH